MHEIREYRNNKSYDTVVLILNVYIRPNSKHKLLTLGPPHPCDFTVRILLGDKLYDHHSDILSTGIYVYIFSLERLVFLGPTHRHCYFSKNVLFVKTLHDPSLFQV